MPIKGANRIKEIVLITGSELIDCRPPKAMAAPEKAPISAWEEEEGIPNHL
jgi:hypothetical protein